MQFVNVSNELHGQCRESVARLWPSVVRVLRLSRRTGLRSNTKCLRYVNRRRVNMVHCQGQSFSHRENWPGEYVSAFLRKALGADRSG